MSPCTSAAVTYPCHSYMQYGDVTVTIHIRSSIPIKGKKIFAAGYLVVSLETRFTVKVIVQHRYNNDKNGWILYELISNSPEVENYLKDTGASEELAKKILSAKITINVTEDDGKWTCLTTTDGNPITTSFKVIMERSSKR